jgi:hypothetical protein
MVSFLLIMVSNKNKWSKYFGVTEEQINSVRNAMEHFWSIQKKNFRCLNAEKGEKGQCTCTGLRQVCLQACCWFIYPS